MPAEIPDGAVIVARAILRSPIWRMRPEDCKVAITLIALVNHTPGTWFDGFRDIAIEKGQLVRSLVKLADDCKLSLQVLRTSLKRLERELDEDGIPFLTRKPTNRYVLYTLPKYPFYQDLSNYEGKANTTSNMAHVSKGDLTRQKGISNIQHIKNQHTGNMPSTPSDPPSKPESRTSPPSANKPLSEKPPSKSVCLTTNKNNNNKNDLNKNKQGPPSDASSDPAPPAEDDRPGGGTPLDHPPQGTPKGLLDQVNYRRGVLLLLSVGIKEETARGLAADRPIGEIVDVVQAARRASNPGGFAVDAIRKGWGVPRAEAARVEIFGQLEADRKKAEASLRTAPKNPAYARLSGETTDAWLVRVNEIQKEERRAKATKR